jgi:hypothetical protein
MTVYAGDDALYKPRKGAPVRVRVWCLTPKRACIIIGSIAQFKVRYVKPERLERIGGGAC